MSYAIACGHRVTAQAAEEILHAGGNAVDAAIAAALAATVAEPVLAGLLGGGFLMVREADGQTRLLDFFVQTPGRKKPLPDVDFRAIQAEFGTTTQEFHVGAGAVATPGVAPGLAEAHARFGHLPLPVLAEPAIQAARQGVTVTGYQAELGRIVGAILTAGPDTRDIFCRDGDPLTEGAIYRNSDYADVLEVFAHEGPRFVTEGEVAQALVRLTDAAGHLTMADLSHYSPEWRSPLTIDRKGARISLNPPPSLGGALIAFALQILPLAASDAAMASALEATTRARIQAALDNDPQGAARLLSPGLVSRYRTEIAGRAAATRGTTQISIVDGDGMGAALTLSNGEGCGLIAPGTGIMPNNMLGEEDLMPGGFEQWKPNRRLASMMAPMVVDWPGGAMAMLGSGGSNRIRSALVQVLTQIIDRNARLDTAIEAPRVHVEAGDPPSVDFEDIGGDQMRETILRDWPQARAWPDRSMFFGGVHAVRRDAKGGLEAAGDPRRAGVSTTA